MSEHISEFKGFLNQLANMKMKLDEKLQEIFLLNILPSSWDTLVVAMTNVVWSDKLTLQSFKESVLSEDMRRK